MPLTKFAQKVIGTLITFWANPQGRGGVNPTITSTLEIINHLEATNNLEIHHNNYRKNEVHHYEFKTHYSKR